VGIYVEIALRNLIQARRRTALLGLALAAVTMLLVLLLALSEGLTDTILRSATTLSSGHVNVAGFYKAKASDATPLVTERARLRKLIEESTPGLDRVIDRARGWGRVITEQSSLYAGLTGIDVAEEERLLSTLRLAEEREYVEGGAAAARGRFEDVARPDHAIIFVGQAKRLGVRPGDTVTVSVETMQGARNTAEFTIAAVAKDIGMMSNWSFFTSKASIRALYARDEDVTGAVQVYLEDPDRSTEVMKLLSEKLEAAGWELMEHDPRAFFMKFEGVAGEDWTGQRLDLTIWSDEVSMLTWVLTAIDTLSFVLVSILMVIIGVGIMNSMWMSVRERTGEIGTLRAVGMSRGRVLGMFLLEALLLGLAATTLGGALGAGLALGLDAARVEIPVQAVQLILLSDVLHLVVRPGDVARAALVFTGLAAVAAFVPALRASRMQPVTAIQHIG
jgi:putative ABC transport system permease protein